MLQVSEFPKALCSFAIPAGIPGVSASFSSVFNGIIDELISLQQQNLILYKQK